MRWLARGCWPWSAQWATCAPEFYPVATRQRLEGRAYDWVMRVRNELHYLTGRRADQLALVLQPEVAANLQVRRLRTDGGGKCCCRIFRTCRKSAPGHAPGHFDGTHQERREAAGRGFLDTPLLS